MKKNLFLLFLALSSGLFVWKAPCLAMTQQDEKAYEDASANGTKRGFISAIEDKSAEWAAEGMRAVSDWCLNTLFKVYNKYVGTFLIYNPDVTDPATYTALIKNVSLVGNPAIATVTNVYHISFAVGCYLLFMFYMWYVAEGSSGLTDRIYHPKDTARFLILAILLFAWPNIHSFGTNKSASLGALMYDQNTLQTSGIFQGMQNVDLDTQATGPVVHSRGTGGAAYTNTIGGMRIGTNLIWFVCLAVAVTGIFMGARLISGGEEAKKGKAKVTAAIFGIVTIVALPTIFFTVVNNGGNNISNGKINGTGVVQHGGLNIPRDQTTTYTTTTDNTTVQLPGTPEAASASMASIAGSIITIFVSLWGIFIVFSVVFAKFFQILSLWVIFILGPMLIAFGGHPRTQNIAVGALWYFIKLLMYSVIWAVTLIGLYLIPNIDWGLGSIGVNTLLTALAVLAGLQLISNTKEFVSLFSSAGGGNLVGSGIREFGAAVATMWASGMEMAHKATGETGQALATGAGAAVGSFLPVIGTTAGATFGQRAMQGVHVVSGLFGGAGGGGGRGGDPSQASSYIQNLAGGMITSALTRDLNKNQSGNEFSDSETQKRDYFQKYAQHLKSATTPNWNKA